MYAKIFASAFSGSLRAKPDELLVWFNMLAHAPGGICDRTHQTIADETGLPVDRVHKAVAYLESPDPSSRSPDEKGRRIVRLNVHRDWGWRLVNWSYYRGLVSEADRREKEAARKQRYRNNQRIMSQNRRDRVGQQRDRVGQGGTSASASVSVQGEVQERGIEASVEATTVTFEEVKNLAAVRGIPFQVAKEFFDYYESNNLWLNRHGRPIRVDASLVRWATNQRQHGTNRQNSRASVDRNAGTANEGRAHMYADYKPPEQ